MKWIICASLLSLGGYFYFSGDDQSSPEAEVAEVRNEDRTSSKIVRGPAKVVQVEVRNEPHSTSEQTSYEFIPADGEAHFKNLLDTDEDEAMVYLRRILLKSKIPVEDKVEFFQGALNYLPREEVQTISRLIIYGNCEPELYLEAMKVQLKEIEPSERENYLRQRFAQTYDKKTRKLIQNIGRALNYEI